MFFEAMLFIMIPSPYHQDLKLPEAYYEKEFISLDSRIIVISTGSRFEHVGDELLYACICSCAIKYLGYRRDRCGEHRSIRSIYTLWYESQLDHFYADSDRVCSDEPIVFYIFYLGFSVPLVSHHDGRIVWKSSFLVGFSGNELGCHDTEESGNTRRG